MSLLCIRNLDSLCGKVPNKTEIFKFYRKRSRFGLLPWPTESSCELINIRKRVRERREACVDSDRKSEENEVVDPIFGGTKALRSQNSRHGVSNPTENATRTSRVEWGIVINVKQVLPLNDETMLLSWSYWTTSKSGIDVESRGLGKRWCIHDNSPNLIEGTPITSEIVNINLTVD